MTKNLRKMSIALTVMMTLTVSTAFAFAEGPVAEEMDLSKRVSLHVNTNAVSELKLFQQANAPAPRVEFTAAPTEVAAPEPTPSAPPVAEVVPVEDVEATVPVPEPTPAPIVEPATAPIENSADAYKAELLKLINQERASHGLKELSALGGLEKLALVRAEEIARSFSHTRPDGSKCFTVYQSSGITYKSAGENLAYGFSQPNDLLKAWLNSPTHKAVLLKPDFSKVGIGYYISDDSRVNVALLAINP